MRVLPADVDVVAIRAAPSAASPFIAATVIGETRDGQLIELSRPVGNEIEGVGFTRADLDAAVGGGDAVMLGRPVPARLGMCAWLIADVDAANVRGLLETAGAWFEEVGVASGAAFLVVRPESDAVRQTLHGAHLAAARTALRVGDTSAAVDAAHRAWLTAQPVTPADVAVLTCAWETAGRHKRAGGLRSLERRQRGEVFDRLVSQELQGLRGRSRFVDALRQQQTGLAA